MYGELKEILEAHGQLHVLKWWNELDEAGRARLARQIGRIDWNLLSRAKE